MSGNAAGHVKYFVGDTIVKLLKTHGFAINKLTSDVVNFNNSGRLCSARLASIIPSRGKSIIIVAKKGKD